MAIFKAGVTFSKPYHFGYPLVDSRVYTPVNSHGKWNMEHLILKGVFPIEHEVNVWVFPKNRGTPKWMVYMEDPIPMDDSGVPLFSRNIHIHFRYVYSYICIHGRSSFLPDSQHKGRFRDGGLEIPIRIPSPTYVLLPYGMIFDYIFNMITIPEI